MGSHVDFNTYEHSEEGRHGVSFGELTLLYVQQPRAASIMCSSDGELAAAPTPYLSAALFLGDLESRFCGGESFS